ncbi:hypothetical protein Tsubulata_047667 [Turnera subulata]|uniref:NB-ARC domain-containing protein n=1 Tax=Turnera subulata TaxID=218843 RepID=A0A9Q0FQ63_9ROSI|nr:hypothetical protein Tsubulata_047667 [Turnera subulata]
MTEAAGPVWRAIQTVCGIACNYATYVHDLKDNVPALRAEMYMLREKEAYVKQLVRSKEAPHLVQAQAVKEWLHRVHQLYTSIDEVMAEAQEEIDHRLYRCCFPKYCCSFTRVGKKVNKKLEEVKQAIREGDFKEVVERRAFIPAVEIPQPKTFGLDELSDDIFSCIRDPDIFCYGICGLPGRGKTTILTKIHNMFCHQFHDFDKVIWVDRLDDKLIFHEIMRRKLEIPDEEWRRSTRYRESLILHYARMKRCILLVDDLELNDLGTIVQWGFPCGHDFKILFTSSLERRCRVVAQKTFSLELMPRKDARLLFVLHARQDLKVSPSIRLHSINNACGRLPLAIVTLGRLLAGQPPQEWERIYKVLKEISLPDEFPPMFPAVQVTYNALPNEIARACFRYFSMFPEASNIHKQEIFDLWYAEGFLGGDGNGDTYSSIDGSPGEYDIVETRLRGEIILGFLKQVGLLEDGQSEGSIKMRKAIQDVALWFEREKGQMR